MVKSSVDTRYHATRVVSHDGNSKVSSPLLLIDLDDHFLSMALHS